MFFIWRGNNSNKVTNKSINFALDDINESFDIINFKFIPRMKQKLKELLTCKQCCFKKRRVPEETLIYKEGQRMLRNELSVINIL